MPPNEGDQASPEPVNKEANPGPADLFVPDEWTEDATGRPPERLERRVIWLGRLGAMLTQLEDVKSRHGDLRPQLEDAAERCRMLTQAANRLMDAVERNVPPYIARDPETVQAMLLALTVICFDWLQTWPIEDSEGG